MLGTDICSGTNVAKELIIAQIMERADHLFADWQRRNADAGRKKRGKKHTLADKHRID